MKSENESAPQARRKNRVSGGEFRDLRGTWSGGGPPGWGGIPVHLGILELVSRNSGNLSTMMIVGSRNLTIFMFMGTSS